MAIHQADVHGHKRAQQRVDEAAIDGYFAGERDLAEGLGVSDALIDELRRQALALYEAGRYDRAIKVVLGVVAMGRLHPADPLLLARCYDRLGQRDVAAECQAHADRLLAALGLEIPPAPIGAR